MYDKAVLTYKVLNSMTPDYITRLLTPMSKIHSLNLRSGENDALYVPFSRLCYTTVYFLAQLYDNGTRCLWKSEIPSP